MHAAVLHKFGSAPRYEQFEDPVAREGEALITVRAASLKRTTRAWPAGIGKSAKAPSAAEADGFSNPLNRSAGSAAPPKSRCGMR
jgi:NADPH:quinone reductase-like Zn-dependent oxidoreductase